MTVIKVWPTSKNALNLTHPEIKVKLQREGSTWPNDGFTARMISDGEVTVDEDRAWKE